MEDGEGGIFEKLFSGFINAVKNVFTPFAEVFSFDTIKGIFSYFEKKG